MLLSRLMGNNCAYFLILWVLFKQTYKEIRLLSVLYVCMTDIRTIYSVMMWSKELTSFLISEGFIWSPSLNPWAHKNLLSHLILNFKKCWISLITVFFNFHSQNDEHVFVLYVFCFLKHRLFCRNKKHWVMEERETAADLSMA